MESLGLPQGIRTRYLEGDFDYLMFAESEERERFGSYLPGLPEEAAISDWGVGTIPLKTAEGYHAGHKTFHPLAGVDSIADLERYPFPGFAEPWRHANFDERAGKAKEQGYGVVGQMSQTILETSYLMRGSRAAVRGSVRAAGLRGDALRANRGVPALPGTALR